MSYILNPFTQKGDPYRSTGPGKLIEALRGLPHFNTQSFPDPGWPRVRVANEWKFFATDDKRWLATIQWHPRKKTQVICTPEINERILQCHSQK